MSTRDIPSTDITQRATIARAAELSAYFQDDLDRESLAREQLETLAALDFSAINTGREIANEMIVGGYAETLESFYSLMPLDMAGLTFGAAPRPAEKALSNLWGEILHPTLVPPVFEFGNQCAVHPERRNLAHLAGPLVGLAIPG